MASSSIRPDDVTTKKRVACGPPDQEVRMRAVSILRRSDGQTMSEYAIVLAVITPAIVAAFAVLSDAVADRIGTVIAFFG